ncbi:MAG: hypothetical protein IKT33_00870 [Clostridia bacterium]|nr:hypothetical protein [Clostridia bacterium]
MLKRSAKIGIVIAIVAVVIISVAIVVYFAFFQKDTYHIVGVEATEFKVEDFTETSELTFNKNNTFRIHIEHKEKGLALTGIGTYTLEKKTYHLTFTQIYARDLNDTIVDITNQTETITCTRSGNQIKFTDHKAQIYYFG